MVIQCMPLQRPGWGKTVGAADQTMRPTSRKTKAVSSVRRIPFLSATEPRKNMEIVMPAVRTMTMWWELMSGLAVPLKMKSEKCMAR